MITIISIWTGAHQHAQSKPTAHAQLAILLSVEDAGMESLKQSTQKHAMISTITTEMDAPRLARLKQTMCASRLEIQLFATDAETELYRTQKFVMTTT